MRRPAMMMAPAAAAMLLCACAACSSPPAVPLPPLARDAVILAFGDSLTAGVGAAASEGYPAVLGRLVGRPVVNAGVPGEITREGLRRLPGVLDAAKPALLILIHGGNDLLRGLDRAQTAANLRAMVEAARGRGVPTLLLGVPAPDLSLATPPFYAETAVQSGAAFDGEILPHILGRGSLKSDLIHPNAAGYRELAEALAGLLRRCGAVGEP